MTTVKRFEGKVALVIGGSAVGRACARRLAGEGARVLLAAGPGASGVAAEPIEGAEHLDLDVTSEDAWVETFARLRWAHGRLDVMLTSVAPRTEVSILETTLTAWRDAIAVNFDGCFLSAKHAIPLMREGGGGSIVNLSSNDELRLSPMQAGAYTIKGAVRLLTQSIAIGCAEAGDGIRANSVHHGPVRPDGQATAESGAVSGVERGPFAALPQARMEDITEAALWLASADSRFLTGAELVIDGGMSLKPALAAMRAAAQSGPLGPS